MIHSDWKDKIRIQNGVFYRVHTPDEKGTYIMHDSVLEIDWQKWGREYFYAPFHDMTFHQSIKIQLEDDECYMDLIQPHIYNASRSEKGTYEKRNHGRLCVEWFGEEEHIPEREKEVSQMVDKKNRIPNIIHFVYGMKKQEEEFSFYKYIAIRSAYEVNRPDRLYFYYHYPPYGEWWEKSKPYLTLEKVDLIHEIYGNPVSHYAHQTDIIRLQKLIERGGVYLDIDTICIHPFHDLYHHSFVMGEQLNDKMQEIYGLCNAVLLSEPKSSFAMRWLETYKTFRSKGRDIHWDEHSVLKPLEIACRYPKEIHITNGHSFFYPLWYHIHDVLFTEMNDSNSDSQRMNYSRLVENSYCIHLWDTYTSTYLKTKTPENIRTQNTLYNILCRKYVQNRISLVFLTYNRMTKTQQCLESYLSALDREDIEELIVFDNGSQEEMKTYLKKFQTYHSKIKIIFHHQNLGVCLGRIELFKRARGDIIVSLDSDASLLNQRFFDIITRLLFDERMGLVGVSGAFIPSWEFGTQKDIPNEDTSEYEVQHIAGCCQCFRRDMFLFSIGLDPFYGKFWVEDTDFSMQFLHLGKINYRIPQKDLLEHEWGGSGAAFQDLFWNNWDYFVQKWKGKILSIS